METTITGNIIRIIDKRTVIINLGSKDSVVSDSIFSIMGEPEKIIDPNTQDELGEVTIVKSRVKAKQVAEKFTIATTKWQSIRFGFFDSVFAGVQNNVQTSETDEGELNVDELDIQPWKAKSESPVKVGDIVKVTITTADVNDCKNTDDSKEISNSESKQQTEK